MSGRIKVGHVELEDYWVYVDSQTPIAENDLIRMAGMLPRDGTMVRCFRGDGSIAKGNISPGETVIVGSRPPPKGRIETPEIDWLGLLSTSPVLERLVAERGVGAVAQSMSKNLGRAWFMHLHKAKVLREGSCQTRLKNFWKTGRRECKICTDIKRTDESLSESDKKALSSCQDYSETRKRGFHWSSEFQAWFPDSEGTHRLFGDSPVNEN
tara:strand:- start:1819 stop:2451 length:633 start_codon:yes stop_codon:yes gene_type:complete